MKRILITAVALLSLSFVVPAFAQDWAGPEIGLQGGYGWGTSSGNLDCYPTSCPPARDPYSFSPNGALGGVHAGYNFQFGQVVLGLEGDAEGAGLSGSKTNPNLDAGAIYTEHTSLDFDASIRGKLGIAWTRALIYGTGGVAFGDVKTTIGFQGASTAFESMDEVRVGWTAGAGAEYQITPNWEAGIEYRYTDLGHQGFASAANDAVDSNEFNFSAVQLRISYRFAPPPPPPPMAPMPAAAPMAPPPPMARTFLVFFDFDRYNLTPDARRVIEAAAGVYKAGGHARLDVSGYTDLAGTQAYNLRLSQRRADAVSGYLMKQGVPKTAMDVKWFGKEHPRVPTADGVREPQNRRVEIMMP